MPIVAFKWGKSIVMITEAGGGSGGRMLGKGSGVGGRVSKLVLDPVTSIDSRKIHVIDKGSICIALTGLQADAAIVVRTAKKICAQYRSTFAEACPVDFLCDELANALHAQTRKAGSRPLGVGLVVGGYDPVMGAQLFTTDAEGSFSGWKAVCLGGGKATSSSSMSSSIKEREAMVQALQEELNRHKREKKEADLDNEELLPLLTRRVQELFEKHFARAKRENEEEEEEKGKESDKEGGVTAATKEIANFEIWIGSPCKENGSKMQWTKTSS